MNLRARFERIERQISGVTRKPIPTDLEAFAVGFAAGDFGIEDIDLTDFDQANVFFAFAIQVLIAVDDKGHETRLSPLHGSVVGSG